MEEKDLFAKEEIVEFSAASLQFGYRPADAGDENDWLSEYYVLDKESNSLKQDLGLLNKCKMRNLVKAPFSKEIIMELVGVDADWSGLNHEQRWKLLRRLKGTVFNELMEQINRIDKTGSPAKKG